MTVGMIFYVLAAIILFLGGIGSTVIPNNLVWGLFCIALGLLLDEYDFGFRRHR
jgi:predicted permease